jgi:hypothetical protein
VQVVSRQLHIVFLQHFIKVTKQVLGPIYKTLIRPVVTYGCESWTMKKEDENIFYKDLRGKLSEEFTAQ